MPPSFDFADWWTKETHRGTPVVVKMENPNWTMLELESPDTVFSADKDRGKNAKQLTWVLLLKAHRAAGCVAWFAHGLCSLFAAIRRRLILKQDVSVSPDKRHKGKLYKFIRGFLMFALFMLCVETVAHWMGWHFSRPHLHMPSSFGFQSLLHSVYLSYKKIKPQAAVELLDSDDLEQPDDGYPMVLVQIPMCNEKEVYEQSISAVCQLDWPRHRILVQVLDDSDDIDIQELIGAEVLKWRQKGINIIYRHRVVRTGYKAGNLNSAMSCDYVKDYEFVAIFDADFQPRADYLKRTIPHFKLEFGE
ncbi:hypothetical protein O6H91_Y484100 [Diphasiastrum complanatum]|nr:hypothetical protein O6H91_Y484100 [Diphasiastrum complanatum]